MDKIIAFLRGAYEFRRNWTWKDPKGGLCDYTDLDETYDRGREFAHMVTLRRFEEY